MNNKFLSVYIYIYTHLFNGKKNKKPHGLDFFQIYSFESPIFKIVCDYCLPFYSKKKHKLFCFKFGFWLTLLNCSRFKKKRLIFKTRNINKIRSNVQFIRALRACQWLFALSR